MKIKIYLFISSRTIEANESSYFSQEKQKLTQTHWEKQTQNKQIVSTYFENI